MNGGSTERRTRLARWMELANLATAGAALLVASVLLIAYQFLSLRTAMVEDLNVQAAIISENSGAALIFHDYRASKEVLGALEGSPSVRAATIFTADGIRFTSFVRPGALAVEPPSPALRDGGHEYGFNSLLLVRTIDVKQHHVGYVVLRATLEQLYGRLAGYAVLTLAVSMGALCVAYLLVARMRQSVKNIEAHLDYLAHVDPVTGLPNRHAFNERLAYVLSIIDSIGGQAGLLLLDLDNFKIVNDTLGHHSGDLLLKLVAQRLRASLRGGDTICRIGGDEFAVILKSADAVSADNMAGKILTALAAPFDLDIHEIYATASIGISIYPDDAASLEVLIRNADTAMYQAKGKGKNAFEMFHPDLDQKARKRLSLETKLRKALERGQLSLHYQPQLRQADGGLAGVEALLRWHHPELGAVSPVEFIPVAEESGLIVPIGRWVFRSACKQAAAWREMGLGAIPVAVNLSVRQTRDDGLVHDILDALHEHGVPPGQLELEITETVLMENVHANVDLLGRLQSEGIRLAVDDFGTGYSSMAYLKRFPINQVKIDRTFVRDIPGDGDDEAITTAIIVMAHSLGLSVVAEGVETQGQLQFLHCAGCDVVQGFHVAQPMAAEEMTAFLRKCVSVSDAVVAC